MMFEDQPDLSKKSRKWFFTLNNPTPAEIKFVKNDMWDTFQCKFLIAGKEHFGPKPADAKTWTPHLQMYMQTGPMKSRRTILKFLPRCRCWPQWADQDSCPATYCEKERDFLIKKGKLPKKTNTKKINQERWKNAIKAAKEQRLEYIEETYPDLYVRYFNTFKKIEEENSPTPPPLKPEDLHVELFYGPAGAGKSRSVYAKYKYHQIYNYKFKSGGWNGYDPAKHKCVLFNDIEPQHIIKNSQEFKEYLDLYPFMIRPLYTFKYIRPKELYLTSNYSPSELFFERDHFTTIYQPFKRRVKCTHVTCLTHLEDRTVSTGKRKRDTESTESTPTEKRQKQTLNEED